MKKFLFMLAGLFVVIFLLLVFVPQWMNWNGYKPKIAAMVKEATGRELRIDGDIQLRIFPGLTFVLSDVHLANTSSHGRQAPEMVSVGMVSGKVRLLPLLGRRVVVDSLIIQEPSVHLEVDEAGRANWNFATPGRSTSPIEHQRSEHDTGLLITGLTLDGVRLSQGTISFSDMRTGQVLNAKSIDLAVALASLDSPLTLALQMHLNDEHVQMSLAVDSPQRLLEGMVAKVKANVASKHVTIHYQGEIQSRSVLGLNGTLHLDIPSMGQLAAWLDQPFEASQPDPGPLMVRAVFESDGERVALTEATIEGKGWRASATGSYDRSGETTKVALNVASDKLDVDQYLPPAFLTQKTFDAGQTRSKPAATSSRLRALFSKRPFDLSPLRNTEVGVRVAMQGIKAMGYEIGQVDVSTNLKNGVLIANIKTLALYGGTVNGALTLDASDQMLDVGVRLDIDRVKVDRLAQAVVGGAFPVTGIASGHVRATAIGESPRRLVESLTGGVVFALGGVDGTEVPAGSISELKVNLDLPGMDRPSRLEGSVVYNKQRVDVDLSTEPLPHVLARDTFVLNAAVESRLLRLQYAGKVQHRPGPGLDGTFNLSMPSVGKLTAWFGRPLSPSQPDPGPLKMQAVFEADGANVTLKTATIEGQALRANARGSYDGSGERPRVVLQVESEALDLDRYMPPAASDGQTVLESKTAASAGNPLATFSDTPFDLEWLSKIAADIHITLGGIRARQYEIGRTAVTAKLAGGRLTTELHELNLYDGNVKGTFTLDGLDKTLRVDAGLTLDKVKIAEPGRILSGEDLTVYGAAAGSLHLSAQGTSPQTIASSVSGKAVFRLDGVEVKGANKLALSGVNVELALPGLAKRSTIKGNAVYKKETVTWDLQLDSVQKALAGQPFGVETALTAKGLEAKYAGVVKLNPTPGLDGRLNLDVSSIAYLMRWLDQPLAKEPPDARPVRVSGHVVDAGARTYQISDLKMAWGANTLTGSITVNLAGQRPQLSAVLESPKLDLRPLLPGTHKARASTSNAKVFPRSPLPLHVLQYLDGTAKLQIAQLVLPRVALDRLAVDARLADGHLTVRPIEAIIGGGPLSGHLSVQPRSTSAMLTASLRVQRLDVGHMLKQLERPDLVSGRVDFTMDVKGHGRSLADVMATLDGSTTLVMGKGRIDYASIDLIGADLATSVIRLLDPFREGEFSTETNCFVSHFDFDNGLARSRALVLDTRDTSIIGKGTVELKTETLNLSLKPSPKKGIGTKKAGKLSLSIGELTKPFKLGGTLGHPTLAIDPTQTALMVGKAAGGMILFGPVGIAAALLHASRGDDNPCMSAIKMAKSGVESPTTRRAQPAKTARKKFPVNFSGFGRKLKTLFSVPHESSSTSPAGETQTQEEEDAGE
jgi:AsmA protein